MSQETPEMLRQARSPLKQLLDYDWLVILIGAVAMAATYPGRTHGLGMVTEPLLEDLRLATPDGRVFYSTLNFWGTVLGSLFCLPVGWLFDRYNRRLILAGNLILLGLSVVWMSRIHGWQLLFATLLLTRGFGQSALSVVSITLVAKSFAPQKLGLAMAFYAILSAPFHLILIKCVGWAMTDFGYSWRGVWCGIGLALIALSLMAAALPKRPQTILSISSVQEQTGSTLHEALATPAFWVFSITISLWGMIYAGVALFNVDIFKERGFDERLYFNVLAIVTVVAVASKLIFGWLVNYVRIQHLLAICLLATAASLGGLPWATQPWHVYLYGVALGIASGAVALLFFAAWGTLYGQRQLGRIQGVAQMMTVLASASGPFIFSISKRATDSYCLIFNMLAILTFAMAGIAWITPLPKTSSKGLDEPLATGQGYLLKIKRKPQMNADERR